MNSVRSGTFRYSAMAIYSIMALEYGPEHGLISRHSTTGPEVSAPQQGPVAGFRRRVGTMPEDTCAVR